MEFQRLLLYPLEFPIDILNRGITISFWKSPLLHLHDLKSKLSLFFLQSDNDLTVYENIVSTDGYNAAQQSAKAAFMESASRQSQRMCLGLLSGEDAVHVKLTLATIQSVKLSFQPSEANLTTLGCDSCTPKPAYVDFKALKTAWSVEYACGDSTCTGACVASLQVYLLILFQIYIRLALDEHE